MDEILTDQETLVLLGARDNLSYAEMASNIVRSKSWIQELIRRLIEKGYLERVRYQHRTTVLTPKGKNYLKENNIRYEYQRTESND